MYNLKAHIRSDLEMTRLQITIYMNGWSWSLGYLSMIYKMNEKDNRVLMKIFYGMKGPEQKIFNRARIVNYFHVETRKAHKLKQL